MTVISADIRRGLSFAGVLILADGGASIAATHGLLGPEWPTRATMAVLGAFLMVTGNAIPKTLAPLSASSCNLASLQRLQRQAGWMFSIAGAGLTLGWLAFPEPLANLLTLMLVPITALIAIQTLRLSRRGRAA
jgi:hypothetical protein